MGSGGTNERCVRCSVWPSGVERTSALALARARKAGKKLARPKASAEIEGKIRDERKKGHGVLKIARTLGVGVSVVQQVLAG